MVLAIEPHIYLYENDNTVQQEYWNVSTRIEDVILITDNGCEVLSSALTTGDYSRCASLIDHHFAGRVFSFSHLLSDDRKRIVTTMRELSSDLLHTPCREIYTGVYDSMEFFQERKEPLLKPFAAAAGHVIERDLKRFFEEDDSALEKLEALVDQVKKWSVEIDTEAVGRVATTRVTALMERLSRNPPDCTLADRIEKILKQGKSINLQLDLFKAQNIYYAIGEKLAESMKGKVVKGKAVQKKWCKHLRSIGFHLKVKAPL